MASDTPGYAVGLDLGDGESALAFCSMKPGDEPAVFRKASMPTAICRRRGDETRAPLIGLDAVANAEGVELNVNFKVDPATEPDRWRNNRDEVRLFTEVLFQQFAATEPDVAQSCRLFIGCPAGWSTEGQALYQQLFEGSSVLPPSEVVAEPRSALVQAWEFEGLPTKALEDRVVLIDVGSSTTDVSVVDGRVARDHPVGADLGLADLDRAIFAELMARQKDPKLLDEQFKEIPSRHLFTLYLCRIHKERSFGAERDVGPILAGRKWASPVWESIQSIDAVDLFRRGSRPAAILRLKSDAAAIPWLDRFRNLLTGLTGPRGVVEPTVVVLTGGGSNIPDLVEAVRAAFPASEVKPGREPHLNVARGLAGYGRLQSRAREFRRRSLELFSAELTSAVIRSAYSGFVGQTVKFYGEHVTDAIWRPMADLWRADELHLNERGEFREFALGLFRDWLDGPGQGSFDDVVTSFSETITAAAAPGIADLAQEFGIPAGGFRLDVSFSPLEPFESDSIVSNAFNQISWKAQGLVFRGVDLLPRLMRKALGGKFLELCLEADKQLRKALMTVIAALISGETPETYRLILDATVERAAAAELDRSLRLIEGLLLGPKAA